MLFSLPFHIFAWLPCAQHSDQIITSFQKPSLVTKPPFHTHTHYPLSLSLSHTHTVPSLSYPAWIELIGGGLVAKSCTTLGTPWTVVNQDHLSMGFSSPEYWSALPFPSPWVFLTRESTQESNPGLLHCRRTYYSLIFLWSPANKPQKKGIFVCFAVLPPHI